MVDPVGLEPTTNLKLIDIADALGKEVGAVMPKMAELRRSKK